MLRTRVIPCLLIKNQGLYKGQKFKDHRYVGDPMNAIKIFNELGADELMMLDIEATKSNRAISPEQVELYASEARMPIAVGGGIQTAEQARNLLKAGAEKVVLNSSLFTNLNLVEEIATVFGSQAIVASIDAKKNWLGRFDVYSHCGMKAQGKKPHEWAKICVEAGVGEILINNIEHDGMGQGYDLELIHQISEAVDIPVIAGCGSSNTQDFLRAINEGGASAVAAASQFVFHGPRRAVLISFPARNELDSILQS